MRVLVGIVGVLLSLPWFVAFWVFRRNFPRQQQQGVSALGLAFGACLCISGGSVFIPSWHRAAVVVVTILGTCYAAVWIGHRLKLRKRGKP